MRFPVAYALICIAFTGGYGIAWYIYEGERPEAYYIAFIVGILFAIGSSWPIKYWMSWLQERQASREYISREQERAERKHEREEKLKKKKNNGEFDHDDFDETSKALLLKIIKEARKAQIRVTGQGLINGILKQIH